MDEMDPELVSSLLWFTSAAGYEDCEICVDGDRFALAAELIAAGLIFVAGGEHEVKYLPTPLGQEVIDAAS